MRVSLGAIHGLADECVVGGIDPSTGDTIASCGLPAGSIPPIGTPGLLNCLPTGSQGPLAPGQTWCETASTTPPVPAGTSGFGFSNTTLIAIGAGVLGVIVLMGMRGR